MDACAVQSHVWFAHAITFGKEGACRGGREVGRVERGVGAYPVLHRFKRCSVVVAAAVVVPFESSHSPQSPQSMVRPALQDIITYRSVWICC